MPTPYRLVADRVAQLHLWRPPGGMDCRVVSARPPRVILTYGTSQLTLVVEDDVEIAEVYRALEQYAAILRRRHRETRRLFQARYAPN